MSQRMKQDDLGRDCVLRTFKAIVPITPETSSFLQISDVHPMLCIHEPMHLSVQEFELGFYQLQAGLLFILISPLQRGLS